MQIRIGNLKKRIVEQDAEKAREPATKKAVEEQAAEPETTKSKVEQVPERTPAEPTPEGPSRLPAYLVFTGAGLAAVGATVTGIMASNEHSDLEDTCSPYCSDDQVKSGKTLALVSTILTGVAVVGVGVGTVLWVTADGSEAAPTQARMPRLGFDVSGDGARARAKWSF